MYLSGLQGVRRASEVANQPKTVSFWQKLPEGVRFFLTGAAGGLIIAALLGAGLAGVV